MEQTMSLTELQFAFFFSNPPINLKFDEFSVEFKKISVFQDKNFDLKTYILPVAYDAPQDMPRCQITSNDNFYLQITGARCDIKLSINKAEEDTIFKNILTSMIGIFENFELSIIRVGYVRRFIFKNENPEKLIKDNFLRIEDDLCEPYIRFLFKHKVDDLIYNDVYEIESAQEQNFSNGELESIILITQDFNTLPENQEIINSSTLSTFLSHTPDQRINSYIALLDKK